MSFCVCVLEVEPRWARSDKLVAIAGCGLVVGAGAFGALRLGVNGEEPRWEVAWVGGEVARNG
jgi:hypothetical protein